MSNFAAQLKALNACAEAVEWVDDRDLTTAWAECERSDWMLWLLARCQIERKTLVSIACDCAERVLVHVPEGEDPPRKAVETARAWCRDEATIDDVRNAADAAYAASYAAYAAYATYAADAAAHAAHAAEHKAQANIIRQYVTPEQIAEAWRAARR